MQRVGSLLLLTFPRTGPEPFMFMHTEVEEDSRLREEPCPFVLRDATGGQGFVSPLH